MVVDAVMNPIIGSLTDGWRSRFGRRLPLMAASLLPLVLLFILMFALPAGLSHGALAIWVAILSSALRICMSVFILPYQALGVELTRSDERRVGKECVSKCSSGWSRFNKKKKKTQFF